MVELLGFTPDAEPQTPGAMMDCQNIVPYEAGMRSAPQPIAVGLAALDEDCRGAGVLRNLAGTAQLLAGTASGIFDGTGGTAWTNVSLSGGYALGDDDRWSFAQFGDVALAATPSQLIQRFVTSVFAEISGAPKAHVIVAAKGFVLAFHTDEATYGDSPDRWWCCALYDDTDWTPNVSTQATTGRLVDGLGAIKAAARFGDDVVAYKERGIFVGRYADAPVVWDWASVSEDVGCVGPEALAVTSIGHIFVGQDNIYLFDGTRPIPLGTGLVRQWWLNNSSGQYRSRTKLLWDRQNNLVWIYFPSKASAGECDMGLVFHVLSKRWGRADNVAEAVLNYYTSGAPTYDGTSPLITTYDASPGAGIPFDSVLWLAEKEAPAIFGSTHELQALQAVASSCSLVTGDFGEGDAGATMCLGVRMKFALAPNSGTLTGYSRAGSGKDLKRRGSSSLSDAKFDVRQTDRYHRFRIELSGDARFSALDVELSPAGAR